MDIQFVYMTAGSLDEARSIGRELVESGLAACVNIIGQVQSMYIWNGKIQDDTEAVLIAKTTSLRLPELIARVRALHSYDCPCIVSLPISGGNPDFLDWVGAQVERTK
ncbi:MAG: divalent-cation tolerance protein CutA [Desulfobacterales bacterium]|jgi:periplasmic divalent cation tolerance protein|nr:divalent-cation tolerance protein CutA [Desulfobacterales bacterium]MDD3081006.1 divalent-cation tolerance protein CutA [Desulfobacterales bacterium]MDD3950411.1 divalent-cation tolerance protein CutA [Desulfobacterales bacterium]MDD4463133.1 divalent-cation tolerance protein CutA [Desulfobacterales bacterium]MDY0377435.1 divalent-cation tolerance protein CutA [Desulfobacterales bacterium]